MLRSFLVSTQFGVYHVREESIWSAMAKIRDMLGTQYQIDPSDVRVYRAWDLDKIPDGERIVM